MEYIFVVLIVLILFYVINKNKKANPDLLLHKTATYEEFKVDNSAENVYKAILQFAQSGDYKIDFVNNNDFQLILNYVPKMGEQTNGTFFPIWVNSFDTHSCNVIVGAKDKSAISMAFEERNALAKLLPRLQAALYSLQASGAVDRNQDPRTQSKWDKDRDLDNDEYQVYLVKKYSVEKNEVLGKFLANGKSYESVAAALLAVHQSDLEEEAQRLNKLALEQDRINNDSSKPHPNTHVKCPDCKGLVRKEATKCRHCGCKLIPQSF